MASAYAAVVSLIHLIDQIPAHHARRPTIFSKKLLGEIKSLKEKASFIQDYLEANHSLIRDSNEAQDLKRRIVDASYAAADVIELHIVDDIRASIQKEESKKNLNQVLLDQEKETASQSCAEAILHVSEAIQKVIQDMDFIAKEVMEIEDLQSNNLTPVDNTLRPNPTMIDHDTMVGFDDLLERILDKLTGQQSTLQIIPITGMGGVGKTTLAQNVFGNSLIKQHFDICGWVTISQVYDIKHMLLGLLHGIGVKEQQNSEYHHLGKILHQHLLGRMYLIIVDDLWNTEAWDKLKLFFPDTKGSRIIVTTRLKDVANYVGSSNLHEINLLDDNKSWSLLCRKVFGQEGCPRPEMEKVGKKIAKNCRGLPLSIVVIGGLLLKSKMTLDYWKYVGDNINKIISSEDSDCLDILLLSYKHLPIHLQPCFLYMGVYPEDHTIRVSKLINLWAVEGFLKPNKLKTLEEVAEEYLKDLIERHLIMVNGWGSLGTMKTCSIHDLLRDLCLREGQKEKFMIEHRMAIKRDIFPNPFPHAFQSTLLVRSLTCKGEIEFDLISNFKHFKLLRVLNVLGGVSIRDINIDLFNLRLMDLSTTCPESLDWVHLQWNLQTLVIHDDGIYSGGFILQIWKMPYLRHLICSRDPDIWKMLPLRHQICSSYPYIGIHDPPQCGGIDDSVLENLQTVSGTKSFKFAEEVVRRIPNVKKLVLYLPEAGSNYYLNNIGRLHKLQKLTLNFGCDYAARDIFQDFDDVRVQNCVFPPSLKKLKLTSSVGIALEDIIITRIGWLPNLEKLELNTLYVGNEWNPVEGQFLRLKVLKLEWLGDLVYWNAEREHFPVLEHLHLKYMRELEEIPSSIGEIATLRSITLHGCKASLVDSAKNILEEQQSFGNEDFRLQYSLVIHGDD